MTKIDECAMTIALPCENPRETGSTDVALEDYLDAIKNNLFIKNLNKTALVFDEKNISYYEMGLNVAKMMAAFEQEELNPQSVVAICLPKSPEHIYTTLACALMGIIWLPIDMASPPARIAYLLSNSRADIAVSTAPLPQIPTLYIDKALENPEPIALADCRFDYGLDRLPAYYLYTSGSTGTPKCVVLNNQATANVLQHTIHRWNIRPNDIFIALTPFHHDMSVFDIFASISVGATLVIPTGVQQKDAVEWAKLVATNQVTLWCSVPAIVDMLFTVGQTKQLTTLRLIAQGGDYIKPSLITQLKTQLPHTRLFSLGGPTETTIWSIWHEIGEDDKDIIPYGKPLKGNQYFILDEEQKPCAVGKVGKMYMSGINLSNGYLLNGETYHSDFVSIKTIDTDTNADIDTDTDTAFRMSDLGYFQADGTIIFAGREAGYLKIKGVRIAATEVENILSKHPMVHSAVVIGCTHPTTDIDELVAIYTIDPSMPHQHLDALHLRDHLKTHLPSSHIPSKFLWIKEWPLTANSKVDRQGLLAFAQAQMYTKPAVHTAHHLTNPSVSSEVAISVLALFKQYASENHIQINAIGYKTALSTLHIKPKQLMKIATQLSNQLNISMDFYALVACQTIEDVIKKCRTI